MKNYGKPHRANNEKENKISYADLGSQTRTPFVYQTDNVLNIFHIYVYDE